MALSEKYLQRLRHRRPLQRKEEEPDRAAVLPQQVAEAQQARSQRHAREEQKGDWRACARWLEQNREEFRELEIASTLPAEADRQRQAARQAEAAARQAEAERQAQAARQAQAERQAAEAAHQPAQARAKIAAEWSALWRTRETKLKWSDQEREESFPWSTWRP
jgi:hypothetical protein